MELSPSQEAASYAATQECPNILWQLNIHYLLQEGPKLVLNLSQINPVHTTPSYFSNIHLNIILPSGIFASGFPTKLRYAFLYMPCPFYPPPPEQSINEKKISAVGVLNQAGKLQGK
jgi:hypothetical protein